MEASKLPSRSSLVDLNRSLWVRLSQGSQAEAISNLVLMHDSRGLRPQRTSLSPCAMYDDEGRDTKSIEHQQL